MLPYLIISLTAFATSFLSLFSGFGLSTVLMPVFAIFFPLPVSVAATAVIHLINNIFKAMLVGKYAEKSTVLRFGIPAAFAAIIGAYLLNFILNLTPIFSYRFLHYRFDVTLTGLSIGLIVITSAFFQLIPILSRLAFDKKYLIPGGLLSGFFGGLSGYQGILRSAFLIKSGLTKEQFIGTSVICSIIVDTVRLIVYGGSAAEQKIMHLSSGMSGIVAIACLAALLGAYLGTKFMEKMTFKSLQMIVGIMLMALGLGMVMGFIQSS